MDPIQSLLAQLGINVASQAVYDFVKSRFAGKTKISQDELAQALREAFPAIPLEHLPILANTLMTEFEGHVSVKAKNGDSATGAVISQPTRIKPGTSITVETENVRNVIGLQIGRGEK